MTRPLRIQYPGALYHVTNRGNERKAIFNDDVDRNEFLKILSHSISTYGIVLHGFVLMKNHWHFLAQTPLANLSSFMRHFNISYTSHYNRRHQRTGHLYRGRYKSFLVEQDSYLSQVSRYVHLNPVKISTMKRLSQEMRLDYLWKYRWSSLPGYLSKSQQVDYVHYETVLAEFGGDTRIGRQRYKKRINEDLTNGLEIRKNIIGQSILGKDDFVSWVRETFLADKNDREQPDIGRIRRYLSQEEVLGVVAEETGINDLLHSTGTSRQIVMTALYNYAGLNNREVGNLLSVDYSTVSQGRKRLSKKAEKDNKIQVVLKCIKEKCQG
jgi:putative transposase